MSDYTGPTGTPPPPYTPDPYIPEHLPVIDPAPVDYGRASASDRDPLGVAGLITVLATFVFVGTYAWSYWDLTEAFSFTGFDPSTVDRLRAVATVFNPLLVASLIVGVGLATARLALGLTTEQSTATRAARTIGGVMGLIVAVGALVAAVDVAFIRDDDATFFGPAEEAWQSAAYYVSAAMIGFASLYLAAWQPGARRTSAFVAPVPSDHSPFGD